MCEDHVGVQGDQLFREHLGALRADSREATVEMNISAFRPSVPFEAVPERCKARLRFSIILRKVQQRADPAHVLALPRPRRERTATTHTINALEQSSRAEALRRVDL